MNETKLSRQDPSAALGMTDKPNYWAVLPAAIRYDPEIPASAKLLYAEISALTDQRGFCWASNAYFVDLYQLSERTIIRLLRTLEAAELMPPSTCRMLTLGLRSGTGDSVMEDISRRMQEDANNALESMVARVEPALVLVTSVLVGVILLSVMLPLMNIMTAIG